MKYKPIIIIPGNLDSVFFEIFFKSLKKKIKSPIILITNLNLLRSNMKKYKFKRKIELINLYNLKKKN